MPPAGTGMPLRVQVTEALLQLLKQLTICELQYAREPICTGGEGCTNTGHEEGMVGILPQRVCTLKVKSIVLTMTAACVVQLATRVGTGWASC